MLPIGQRRYHITDDPVVEEMEGIQDKTETNLVNLRRVIYLTIMNALNYEEAVHKLLKVQIKEGQEVRIYQSPQDYH